MTTGPARVEVIEEWCGREWSRITHSVVVADADGLVTYERAGTIGRYATSRGVPGREDMSRSERKLMALETLEYRFVQVPAAIDTLHFWQADRYAHVNRGWRDGQFLGWYVNFAKPPVFQPGLIVTMDLVLDALVTPDGTWVWKDEADYEEAVSRGLIDVECVTSIRTEVGKVRDQLAHREGPFAGTWDSWVPSRGI